MLAINKMIDVATLVNLTLICTLSTQECVLTSDNTPLTTFPFKQLNVPFQEAQLDVGPLYKSWLVQWFVNYVNGPNVEHCCTCENKTGCCPAGCAQLPRRSQIGCCVACAFGGCNITQCLAC